MTEVRTVTLTEFLLARVASREAEAKGRWEDVGRDDRGYPLHVTGCDLLRDTPYPCDCDGPARVLAECEAKRRIVELHEHEINCGEVIACNVCGWWDRDYGWANTGLCETLRLLALPHASHPDYRPEWAV